ncbi:unnamed protein product [Microthlaspi erraticum]|uniref:Uncharacterized protein n=1 Tax=Microthlaspi erraticum TaxID=1685480 RepID=A0A6D2IJ87_9BRAS|nr:unnamed protein product [Microthlaspi erraticum]
MFHARPNLVRPSEVSAKVQNRRPITHHDPGNYCPRSATPRSRHRARPNRRAGKSLAAAQPSRTTHERVRAGKLRPASGRDFIGQITRPTTRPTTNPSDPTVPTRPQPDCPADRPDDRPNAAVDPKPVLKPNYFSRPGLTLSRL